MKFSFFFKWKYIYSCMQNAFTPQFMYSVPEIASKLILKFIIGYLWPVFQCGHIVTVSDKNTFEPKNKKPQKTLIHTFNK